MVLREIFRVPMGVFDEYRALCFKQPRTMNFWMMNCIMLSLLYFGKGFEKISLSGGPQAVYESFVKHVECSSLIFWQATNGDFQ
jgi:hypothetical protein